MSTRFGVQPAREELAHQGWSIAAAAEALGENYAHLKSAVLGRVTPCGRLRESLPELLSSPVEELFTEESLAATYGGSRRYHVSLVPVRRRTRREIAEGHARTEARR